MNSIKIVKENFPIVNERWTKMISFVNLQDSYTPYLESIKYWQMNSAELEKTKTEKFDSLEISKAPTEELPIENNDKWMRGITFKFNNELNGNKFSIKYDYDTKKWEISEKAKELFGLVDNIDNEFVEDIIEKSRTVNKEASKDNFLRVNTTGTLAIVKKMFPNYGAGHYFSFWQNPEQNMWGFMIQTPIPGEKFRRATYCSWVGNLDENTLRPKADTPATDLDEEQVKLLRNCMQTLLNDRKKQKDAQEKIKLLNNKKN